MTRWAVFVHDPDGDMGYGTIVGPFNRPESADARAEAIIAHAGERDIECVVVPVTPTDTPIGLVCAKVLDDGA